MICPGSHLMTSSLDPSLEPELSTCAVHGLHFDPRLTRGCVLCRRSTRPPPQRAPAGAPLLALALLLFVAAITLLLSYPDVKAKLTSIAGATPAKVASATSRFDGNGLPEDE